jgi:hypothetical protein
MPHQSDSFHLNNDCHIKWPSSRSPPRHNRSRPGKPVQGNAPPSPPRRKGRACSASPNRGRTDHHDRPRDLSACALCLGRHPHRVSECRATQTWDGKTTYCTRDHKGQLINPRSQTLCLDWQRPRGCTRGDHAARHKCSGCRSKSHGAQTCPCADPPSASK